MPVHASPDVKANILLILTCAWHQVSLREWWDLFPCSFAWPWYRVPIYCTQFKFGWSIMRGGGPGEAATTRHLPASHPSSMALPSYLCLKVLQWLPMGKRASQWDLGEKLNSWHPLLSTSPAFTEPFSFSFLFTLTLLQNDSCLLMWNSALPLLPSFQYLPKHAPSHVDSHMSSFARELWSLREMKTPIAYSACPIQRDCFLPCFYLVGVIQVWQLRGLSASVITSLHLQKLHKLDAS